MTFMGHVCDSSIVVDPDLDAESIGGTTLSVDHAPLRQVIEETCALHYLVASGNAFSPRRSGFAFQRSFGFSRRSAEQVAQQSLGIVRGHVWRGSSGRGMSGCGRRRLPIH